MPRRLHVAFLLTLTAALLAPAGSARAGLPVYVVEQTPPSVQVVDATTGAKSELAAGNLLSQPTGVALEPSGDLVVSDAGRRAVIRIDRDSGAQEYVSSGTNFGTPSGIAVRPNGDILVTDEDPDGVANLTFSNGALVKVHPGTGATTLLSYDNRFENPLAVAADGSGDALVADPDGPSSSGSIIRVNGTTNVQTNVAQGSPFEDPSGIVVERSGSLLVADVNDDDAGQIVRVTGGAASVLSPGGVLVAPRGIALERSGSALVADRGAGTLVRVAPTDGAQSVLNASFTDPVAVAVPADEDADLVADAVDNCLGLANAGQENADGDAEGNACDADDDNDTLTDASEGTLGTNPLVADTDADGARDDADNCALAANAGQENLDLDTLGNACDADDDNDGVSDADETAAGTDPLDQDTDGDSNLDGADNCALVFNVSQADADVDGTGDACEAPAPGDDPEVGDGTGTDPSPTPTPPPAPAFEQRVDAPIVPQAPEATIPQPVLGESVAVAGRSGRVTVRLRGRGDVELRADGQIPVGAIVDTTFGSIILTSALPDGSVQSARLFGGRFSVNQRSADGVTDLRLAGPAPRCKATKRKAGKKRRVARAAAKQRKAGKRLWGDGHGRFRTHGRDAVASVRGTRWLVEDTCRGTRVRVARGVVSVKGKRAKRTFLLRAGQSRLVKRS